MSQSVPAVMIESIYSDAARFCALQATGLMLYRSVRRKYRKHKYEIF